MPIDLQSVQIAVTITIGVLTILGVIFGWFGKVWHWGLSRFRPKVEVGVIDIPKRTVILLPMTRPNALWWHMGAIGDQPAMQIVGDLNVTNISKVGVYLMGARLRKPKAFGDVAVRAQGSHVYGRHMIPKGTLSDLRFHFFVQPPRLREGQNIQSGHSHHRSVRK